MPAGGFRNNQKSKHSHLQKLEALFGDKPKQTETVTQPKVSYEKVETSFNDLKQSKNVAPSQYRMRLERIRVAKDDQELQQAIESFVLHHELPGDLDIILKILEANNEAYVRRGLGEIVNKINSNELTGTSVVLDALNKLEAKVTEEQTRSYIIGIRDMLA